MASTSIAGVRARYPGKSDSEAAEIIAAEDNNIVIIVKYRFPDEKTFSTFGLCYSIDEAELYLSNLNLRDVENIYDRRRPKRKNFNDDVNNIYSNTLLRLGDSEDLDDITKLLNSGANVNARNSNGETPLMLAIVEGHLDSVKLFFEHGAYVNDSADDGTTPLMLAAYCGHVEILKFLIQEGAALDASLNGSDTALYFAINNGSDEAAVELIINGTEVNTIFRSSGWPPLLSVIQNNKVDIVEWLLEAGADYTVKIGTTTALGLAAKYGFVDILDILINRGVDINERCGDVGREELTPLLIASMEGYLDVVHKLLENGADSNGRGAQGTTPLMLANGVQIVEALLAHGADVKMRNENGTSAFCVARNMEIAQILLDSGSKIDEQDNDGRTKLIGAASNGNVDFVKYLLDHGADSSICWKGRTALSLAERYGHVKVVEFLNRYKVGN